MTTHRTALITDGMDGLDEVVTIRLYMQGHRIVVTHSLGNIHVTTQVAEQHIRGRPFQTFAVDIVDYDACQRCTSDVLTTIDPIDILVNSAGVTQDMTFKRMALDAWRNMLATNPDSVFNTTRPLYESVIECGWGRIINTSSVNEPQGTFGQTNYATTGTSIHGLTKALTLEYAAKGVAVNIISPGCLVM